MTIDTARRIVGWGLLLTLLSFLGYCGYALSDKEAREFLFGFEWEKRTKITKTLLEDLPEGYVYEMSRYENTDTTRIWGPNGEYIFRWSLKPEDFEPDICGPIADIKDLEIVCDSLGKELPGTTYCANNIFHPELGTQGKTSLYDIVNRHDELYAVYDQLPKNKDEAVDITPLEGPWFLRKHFFSDDVLSASQDYSGPIYSCYTRYVEIETHEDYIKRTGK